MGLLPQVPSTRIRVFWNPQLFLSGHGFRLHVSGESRIRIRNFLNPLSWVEMLNTPWIRNRVEAKSGYFFYLVMKQDRAQFFTVKGRERCKFPALDDACSVANIPRGVLSTRVHPDTRIRVGFVWTGKIRFEYWYLWTWKFLNSERTSFRLKNIGIRVDGALGFEWMRGWGWRCFDGKNSFLSLWKLCLKNTS